VDCCQETQSIAEISARLGMPVNVTRILVDDLSEGGLVVVYQPPAGGARPSVELLERVLHGLRAL
jgi:DNA-binding IscR family transcriptional regulator